MLSALCRKAACLLLLLPLSACAWMSFGSGSETAAENPQAAQQHEALADLYLRGGRPDLAAAGYEKALSLHPGDAGLHVKRGRALLRLNRPDMALKAFAKAQTLAPDSPDVLRGGGEALYRLDRLDEAEQALRRSIELAPENWRVHCLLGLVLEAAGRPDMAAVEYLAALAAPGSIKARPELLNNLAMSRAQSGDLEGGVRTMLAVLATGNAPERVSNNMGLLLVRLGRYDEALNAFRMSGDDPRALNNMGYALLLKGDAQTAQILFEKALQASPQYYGLADENLTRASFVANAGPVQSQPDRPRARLLVPEQLPQDR